MNILNYLKINKLLLISYVIIVTILNFIIFSSTTINKGLSDLLYMNILIVFIQFTFILYDYKKQQKKYSNLLKSIEGKVNIQEYNAYNDDFHISTLLQVLRVQQTEFNDREDYYKKTINYIQEDITQWVHDIKVNMGICELLLEDIETEIENESISKLSYQIEQIKFRVNQVLNVTRVNHYNLDIVVEELNVSKVIKSAIKENAIFFINKNIRIITEIKEILIVSDKKWFLYIISQILNNCSKYTPNNGEVSITTTEDECAYYIYIKDNGVGIPKEDINRVFDKGFIGSNGRTTTKSTGMGLYYVKKIAEKLRIGINIESEKGKYTQFTIMLYKLSDYYNITKIDS